MNFNKRIHFKTITSTNTYLKENYQQLENGTVITASNQTQGRGRMERTWINGDDILMSILIKEKIDIRDVPKMGLVVAASVFTTLSKYLDNVKIKWPNDIIVNHKKICGILIESVIINKKVECLIIGIGINVNTTDFPVELSNKATSMRNETTNYYNIDSLIDELINDFSSFYHMKNQEFLWICKKHSCLIGKNVIIDDFKTKQMGKVLDILENGNILMDFGYELRQYNSGEVTFINISK